MMKASEQAVLVLCTSRSRKQGYDTTAVNQEVLETT